ncbi:MAG: hypothetical protein B7Z80_01570 [Rhodospirillales bacterium 20-64-7]|nr:MAG: hypothetical protein B7Z80_01570 [Rhodospirillales bacterium 20-64-7]HQT76648.1 hypothetical protein [Rhodopila sp.]
MTTILSPDSKPRAGAFSQPVSTAVIVAGCVCLSALFACATPFAALATLAALTYRRYQALAVVAAAWAANQAIGYFLLGYPWTWDSAAWGVAIGMSASLAVLAVMALPPARSAALSVGFAFIAAFVVYQAGLYAASFVLPGGDAGFTASVVGYVFLVNTAGLVLLMITRQLLAAAGGILRTASGAKPLPSGL